MWAKIASVCPKMKWKGEMVYISWQELGDEFWQSSNQWLFNQPFKQPSIYHGISCIFTYIFPARQSRHATHTSQMLRYFGDLHCRPPRNILWTVDCRFADVNPLHCFLKASFRSLSNPIHTALKHSCSWSLRITASRTKLQETKITATRPEATDW